MTLEIMSFIVKVGIPVALLLLIFFRIVLPLLVVVFAIVKFVLLLIKESIEFLYHFVKGDKKAVGEVFQAEVNKVTIA